MELTIIEHIIVFYWFLLDIQSYNDFEYYKSIGLQVKYAFEKALKKL